MGSSIASTAGVDVIKLPEVQRSRLNWLEAKQEADRQVQANKPVPNLGVGVGKQAGESIISLNVSVPIQWRNDYREVNEAAREAALASEQQLHAKMLSAQEKLRSLRLQFRQTQQRYEQWRDLHENYLSEEITVLQNRYAQGDLSMADYQWQVQQLRAGMQAGLTLKQNYQITFIAYLHATGRLAAYVLSLNLQEQ
ncbi:MAG: TolC family protein [Paraglaciecola sp.]